MKAREMFKKVWDFVFLTEEQRHYQRTEEDHNKAEEDHNKGIMQDLQNLTEENWDTALYEDAPSTFFRMKVRNYKTAEMAAKHLNENAVKEGTSIFEKPFSAAEVKQRKTAPAYLRVYKTDFNQINRDSLRLFFVSYNLSEPEKAPYKVPPFVPKHL